MGYENAPATKMLATYCAVCARPLLDSVSVEIGIGPECRKKYGYYAQVDPEVRETANALVHEIAVLQHGVEAAQKALRLEGLGFPVLSKKLLERLVTLRVTQKNGVHDVFEVETPYNAGAVEAFKRIPGRRPRKIGEGKASYWVNEIPGDQRKALWDLFKAHFQGHVGLSPKGIFHVDTIEVQA